VRAVEGLKEAGYKVKDACSALGISRSGYYAAKRPKLAKKEGIVGLKDKGLIEKIKGIKGEHPFWGYRRVWAWLRHREGIKINQKRVRRMMKEQGLMASQRVNKEKRAVLRRKPRADKPKQIWGIDMTKFMVKAVGWVYLVIVLDWYTRKVVGWDISLRSRSEEWKRAVDMGINREFPEGVRGAGLKLVSDNGSQPTSVSFMRDMGTLGIEQIFTTYDNPKGNAETERMMRTIKEEIIWVNEFETLEEAIQKIGKWIENDYNMSYVHSKLGYMSPNEFEALYYQEREGKVA